MRSCSGVRWLKRQPNLRHSSVIYRERRRRALEALDCRFLRFENGSDKNEGIEIKDIEKSGLPARHSAINPALLRLLMPKANAAEVQRRAAEPPGELRERRIVGAYDFPRTRQAHKIHKGMLHARRGPIITVVLNILNPA